MDHQNLKNNYGEGEEKTKQERESGSKILKRFKTAGAEKRAERANRGGIQILSGDPESQYHRYQTAAAQEARLAMTKAELRKSYLEKRSGLSVVDAASMSTAISDTFFFTVNLSAIRNLHCYLPIEKFNEPNTKLILERVWQEFPEVITSVPRIDFATNELSSVIYSSTCPVARNKWGVSEPDGGTVLHAEAVDLAIVPLLCFDEAGYRVGYGKGYYDRFLAKCRPNCLKVGLSFFPPVEKIEDTDEFDVPLDLFITPENIYRRDAEAEEIQTG